MTNKKSPKSPYNFSCLICDYYTSNKKDYNKHISTVKHCRLTNTKGFANENPQNPTYDKTYLCNCGKSYKHMSSLCKHKNKCNFIQDKESEFSDKELIMMLLKENKELKTMMIEQQNIVLGIAKNGTCNITNSNNKTFNLNFFLNETCKDAMNIMDFVDSIKLQLSDLENVGKLGYVEGISNIITNNLKALDITQRPVHCTDKKRDILYIKDENKWGKEDEDKRKIRKVIKRIASKNALMLPKFKEKYPDCVKSSSPYSDQYNKLIVEAMGGPGDNNIEKEDKIIKNIVKNVTIDK